MTSLERRPIAAADIETSPSSYVDPNGFVFHHDGEIYRAIYTRVGGFYRSLFEDGTIDALVAKHRLVPSAIAPLTLPRDDVAFVVHHETIRPITYCLEWCPSMLRDAGAALLDLALAILDRGCVMQDCYPWNVLMRGTEPVVIDLTSIARVDTPLLWPAFQQFQSFFLRPLELSAQGKGKVARALLRDNIEGITLVEFYRASSFRHRVTHPLLAIEASADWIIQRSPALKRSLKRSLDRATRAVDTRLRRRFLSGLLRRLGRFKFARHADIWSDYYRQIDPSVDREIKLKAITDTLRRLRPATVLDVGCNTGVFSVIAAREGSRVVAVDSSEACVEHLYAAARADGLNITPLVLDILCPTPASGFMGRQYPGFMERARADLVLCLGLMHHLHITGRQPFARIADLMQALSTKHLVFEFIARDDENVALLGTGRPIEYDLQTVIGALSAHFPDIDVMHSDRATRRLLLCSR